MKQDALLNRIVLDPGVMVGKPVIRGTRLTVDYILGLVADGASMEEILGEYAGLDADDLRACLHVASESLASTDSVPSEGEGGRS